MRKKYLHVQAYSCDECKGPLISGSTGIRENEICRETDVREVGAPVGTGQAKQPSWASPVTFHPSSGSEMGASAPPVSTQSRRHDSICRTEYAMASVEEVQQVVMTWLAPFRAKRQFNSLESDPITPVGIQNRLILLVWPLNKRRYVSSVNSCDPPPVPP